LLMPILLPRSSAIGASRPSGSGVWQTNLSPSSSLMTSDRDDLRNLFRGFERPSATPPSRSYTSDSPEGSEDRIQHLVWHLRTLGRLNIYILAREWDCTPGEVIRWLTALHHAGRL